MGDRETVLAHISSDGLKKLLSYTVLKHRSMLLVNVQGRTTRPLEEYT